MVPRALCRRWGRADAVRCGPPFPCHPTSAAGLTAPVFRTEPGRAEGCDLQPVAVEPPIALSYATSTVPRGCVSSSSLRAGHEVHVLSVEWSKVSKWGLALSAWCCHPGIVTPALSPITVPTKEGVPALETASFN